MPPYSGHSEVVPVVSEGVVYMYAHIAKHTHTRHEGENGVLNFWARD